jgi:peptidoglycan/xylan/chitin deacetylase (PgdA/CDA1 family)
MRWWLGLSIALALGCAGREPRPALRSVAVKAAPRIPLPSAADPEPPRWQFRHATVPREHTIARVLLYHSFGWFSEMRPAVTPYAFRTQLDWLDEHEIELIPLGALLDFLDGRTELPARVAVLTIDDGELNGFTVAFPILQERSLPFTLAIATEATTRSSTRGTIPWSTLREMLDSKLMTIACHGHAHLNSTVLDDAKLAHELEASRGIIERELGVRPEAFVYPLGAHDPRVQRAAQAAGYRAAFAARGGPVTAETARFAVPRYAVEQSTSLFTFAYYFRHSR